MEFIANLDKELFIMINSGLTAPWLDALMPYVTEKFNFLGAIIVAAVLILVLGKRKDRVGLAVLVLLVASSDFAADGLKHLIMRVRPCNDFEVRLLVGCGGSFSLPSGHATNIFSSMVFLSARYKKFTPFFLLVAFTVAYSRVYVGVHYPMDVVAGAMLGASMALLFREGEKRATRYYLDKRGSVEA